MKKYFLVLLVLITTNAFAETVSNVFTDLWQLDDFIAEYPDGTLISSFVEYSYPYTGINQLEFFEGSFVVITIKDKTFRAFYDIETLDYDNVNLKFTLKNDEIINLKLTKGQNEQWLYFYRIPENSILCADLLINKSTAANEDNNDEEAQNIDKNNQIEDEKESSKIEPATIFTGIMKRLRK